MLAAAAAQAQTSVRVRGTITAIDGNILSVASRDGRELKITLADNVAVSVAKAVRFADIKQGDYVGATTMPGPNGMPVAIEVHYLPPSVPPGQLPWDLQAGSTMTNANVASMVSGTSGHRADAAVQQCDADDRGSRGRADRARGARRPHRPGRRRIRVPRRAGGKRRQLERRPRPGQQGRGEAAAVIVNAAETEI